jgi:FMN phosphatase YigB (HAD superfamily)
VQLLPVSRHLPLEPRPLSVGTNAVQARPDWVAGLSAITFDFGNTLVPVRHEALRAVVDATARRVVERSGPFALEAFLEAWADERDRQFAEDVPEFREVEIPQRVVRVLARLRGMAVPPRDARWDDALAATYCTQDEVAWTTDVYSGEFVRRVAVPDGVGPMLERLSRRYRLGVLSNWPLAATIDRYVEAAGWAPWLHAVVVSERVGTIKPHPDIFRSASDGLGVAPDRILHVGDDWAADVVGAKAAGWRAAYLRAARGSSPLPESERDDRAAADLELSTITELEAALEERGA